MTLTFNRSYFAQMDKKGATEPAPPTWGKRKGPVVGSWKLEIGG